MFEITKAACDGETPGAAPPARPPPTTLQQPLKSCHRLNACQPANNTHHGDASIFLLCAKGRHDQGRSQYLGTPIPDVLGRLVNSLGTSSRGSNDNGSSGGGGSGGGSGSVNEAVRAGLAHVVREFRGVEVKREYVGVVSLSMGG
ncbi:hypothetical protein F5144DRAFT_655943 [Chaetomium tenue]|uniref:Uncharacterized protein n=1 Tax=Chaetomium tenue TaxID=1854479 RepID=A0ACB7NW76_9PEZI|nr:hypothetical protein F5144DRAFT_655943 [Chaetomium globosum]